MAFQCVARNESIAAFIPGRTSDHGSDGRVVDFRASQGQACSRMEGVPSTLLIGAAEVLEAWSSVDVYAAHAQVRTWHSFTFAACA
jgi:hypothetical protein